MQGAYTLPCPTLPCKWRAAVVKKKHSSVDSRYITATIRSTTYFFFASDPFVGFCTFNLPFFFFFAVGGREFCLSHWWCLRPFRFRWWPWWGVFLARVVVRGRVYCEAKRRCREPVVPASPRGYSFFFSHSRDVGACCLVSTAWAMGVVVMGEQHHQHTHRRYQRYIPGIFYRFRLIHPAAREEVTFASFLVGGYRMLILSSWPVSYYVLIYF